MSAIRWRWSIAETLAEAKDAAELIEVDYEALPAVVGIEDALKPGAPRVWDENPDNVSHIFETGNKAAADAAFAAAAHVVKTRYVITRVHAQYMETRGTVGVYDPSDQRFTLHADVQYRASRSRHVGREYLQDSRRPRSASSPAMSAAASAPRAGSMSSIA